MALPQFCSGGDATLEGLPPRSGGGGAGRRPVTEGASRHPISRPRPTAPSPPTHPLHRLQRSPFPRGRIRSPSPRAAGGARGATRKARPSLAATHHPKAPALCSTRPQAKSNLSEGRPASRPLRSAAARRAGQGRAKPACAAGRLDAPEHGGFILPMKGRYPEAQLQQLCTDWLLDRDFVQIFDDVSALGERVDSVGVLNGRLWLIEYKVTVPPGIIRHQSDRSMSLESKLAGALGPLYRREGDRLSVKANAEWDRSAPPVFVVATEQISEGSLQDLVTMLAGRAVEWRFHWQVWKWTGSEIITLAEGADDSGSTAFAEVEVPRLLGRTPRAGPRTIAEMRALAEQRSAGLLFDVFVGEARRLGFRVSTQRTTLTATRLIAGRQVPCAAIYLGQASPVGALNIGLDADRLSLPLEALPGSAASSRWFSQYQPAFEGSWPKSVHSWRH